MYSVGSNYELTSSLKHTDSSQPWNQHHQRYHFDYYHPRNDSFHSNNPYSVQKSTSDDTALEKFQQDTPVKFETGETKKIQYITTNDFLISAKQSQQYSSRLARVEYIGSADKLTGKVELRFYVNELQQMISYHTLQEMPFFVYQYSCWSSISPEHTRRVCGLNCRQLECGDLIIAVTEHAKVPSKKHLKPDYTQQSPTKCLVERYMNEKISSVKEKPVLKKPTISDIK